MLRSSKTSTITIPKCIRSNNYISRFSQTHYNFPTNAPLNGFKIQTQSRFLHNNNKTNNIISKTLPNQSQSHVRYNSTLQASETSTQTSNTETGALDLLFPTNENSFQKSNSDLESEIKDLTEETFSAEKMKRERSLELAAVSQAHEKYLKIAENVTQVKAGAQMPSGKTLILRWYQDILKPIKKIQERARKRKTKGNMAYDKLITRLPADKLAIITVHTTLSSTLLRSRPTREIAIDIGEAIQAQINYEQLAKLSDIRKNQISSTSAPFKINNLALRMLEEPSDWPTETLIHLGISLLDVIVSTTTVPSKHSEGTLELAAFDYEQSPNSSNEVSVSPALKAFVDEHNDLIGQLNPKHLPTIVPPKDWSSASKGGYHYLKSRIMRTRGSQLQLEVLKDCEMPQVLSALNALGSTPWQINNRVLKVMEECWERGMEVGDVPPRFGDIELPTPDPENFTRETAKEHAKATKYNQDLNSLRCDWLLKLKVARDFRNDRFYFPHNVDFRGRAYPIPPHLNHVGSDVCRGLLQFDKPQPLGTRGLRWLKIHLANLYGKDKFGFEDRIQWVEENMDNVINSAQDPLGGEQWWMNADEPFECLAACFELEEISRCEEPEKYMSRIPVQMDGSCNGLQHYAALGRDEHGAEHVNLLDSEKPMDVYLRVREVVLQHLDEAADSGDETAKLLIGKVERSTIKQTVMTSVYGVTLVGAREQIQRRLKESNVPDDVVFRCAAYLAQLTLKSLGEVFSGAYNIMDWLTDCAHLISSAGYPVMWPTPLGLPIVQPYRNNSSSQFSISTILQTINLVRNSDDLPVNVSRQRSAFPPNYVHSIDATHMFMTANECAKRGMHFASVHDSFWTHANDVDEMNQIIREQFVELHSQPLLETLLESFQRRYPDIQFPDVPRRGALDLIHVLDSKYFFD
eukprot:gb/GECH01003876.1/.p1 GENE.gb/GECH01003876.1/~~gb/GECH01003876.1/.p1  ORF type:complete len:918 (+),score=223.69 gb/GECH01003876.1/:1-2754(+)